MNYVINGIELYKQFLHLGKITVSGREKDLVSKNLFIVDDDEGIRDSLSMWFTFKGYNVKTFFRSKELLECFEEQIPDVLLLDINLKNEDGRDICLQLKKITHFTFRIILFSANSSLGRDYEQYKADAFIGKPFSLTKIASLIALHS